MSATANADVRGFYAAIGIELPGWSDRYARVRCFIAPEEHTSGDRTPSMSIDLTTGRFHCFGCCAWGDGFDAAIAAGCTRQTAMERLVAYGLREPSERFGLAAGAWGRRAPPRPQPPPPPPLQADEADIATWIDAFSRRPKLLARLASERGWRTSVLVELEVGVDFYDRLTIPIRDAHGTLRGVLRYRPWRTRAKKMLTVKGTRFGLVPHPARERSRHVVLVEGLPDMVSGRSYGLPAIAVPGIDTWRADWGPALAGRRVTVMMDADKPGRTAASRIYADLKDIADVTVVDIAPDRDDGYDLSDLLHERRNAHQLPSPASPQSAPSQPTQTPAH
jgi:hypothetical protein